MIAVGAQVGNYRVTEQIGEGGMGLVWLAEHPLIGRRVAIKVIHPTYAKNPEAVSRFFTEAQAVNKIGHPNIVDVTDYGTTADGECYIVMEYLDGESLHARMSGGGLDLRRAVHVAAQTADALAASHAAGVLHRDLKPDNIHLVQRGQDPDFVKVLDFGLAKLQGDPGGRSSQHKTRTGSMMGTPYYMAPEQCAGKADIDGRADIYALGVILFEMCCGRVPFPGDGYAEIIVGHMTQPAPRAGEIAPNLPGWLDALVDRCLAKDRAARPQSMAELRDALLAQLAEMPGGVPLSRATTRASTSQPPAAPISTMGLASGEAASAGFAAPTRSRLPLFIGGAAVLAAAVVIGVVATRGGEGKPAPAAAATPPPPPPPAPVAPDAALAASPPPPAQVSIDLGSEPPGARVLDAAGDEICAATPCSFKTAPSDTPIELRFEKPGYEPRTKSFKPDGTAQIVGLTRSATKPRPDKPKPDKPKPDKPEPDKPKTDTDLLKPQF